MANRFDPDYTTRFTGAYQTEAYKERLRQMCVDGVVEKCAPEGYKAPTYTPPADDKDPKAIGTIIFHDEQNNALLKR